LVWILVSIQKEHTSSRDERFLKKIEAIVRSERANLVKQRLREIGIAGMTISNVSGWSKQRELHLQWRGQKVEHDLLPRIKFEILVTDSQVDSAIQTIIESARIGEHGDGIVFVSSVEKVINITTMDQDDKAV
jgi:nitrogen regulatory protein P-II 1